MKNIFKLFFLTFVSSILIVSCTKEEYLNPSQATESTVVKDVNGLIALANGLQYRYSVSRTSPIYSYITANALTTNEWLVLNQGNTDEANLQAGKGNVIGNNAVVSRLWEQCNLVKSSANLIINNLGFVGDTATRNGLICYANLYKGLSLLQLGTFWEQAPINVGKAATFSPRAEVLAEAVSLFESGLTASSKATFSSGLQGGIDFPSTFNALIARTYLMLNNYDKALAAANKVDLTKKSEFTFDAVSKNPIFETHYSNVNVCEPVDNKLGLTGALAPDATDGRLLFYLKSLTFTTTANEGKGFFTSNVDKIPLYLPGEIILIKAECLARNNDVPGAITELNKVLTKKTDIFNVNANLTDYSGAVDKDAVLLQIYKNRCIELFNSGLKLDDSRRFGRPGPTDAGAERNRNFYPYPNSERDNNPNTPADPSI